MLIEILETERAFLIEDGTPTKYLTPGAHRVGSLFHQIRIERLSVAGLVAELDARRLALVPAEDLQVVTIADHQRALVSRRGKAVSWLKAGVHQIWTVDRTVDRQTGAVTPLVTIQLFDTRETMTAPLLPEVAKLATAAGDYVEVTAPAGTVVVRFIDGQIDAVLPAGRHAAWTTLRAVILSVIDLRERVLAVTGQDVMTRDRVTLRLNVSATIKVADAVKLATVARAPDDVVYLAMQMAAREAVTTRTLDELLQAREALSVEMTAAVKERAASVGLELIELGVKDVVLPGEMKDLLNKVIQAQKEAEANVIARREETAATRSLAQTAKVLSENPLLMRLKELETYKELAGKVGKVHLVLGDGALEKLQLKT